MSFDVSCPSCHVSNPVPDDEIGKIAKCRNCGEKIATSLDTNPNLQAALDEASDFSGEAEHPDLVDTKDYPDRLSGRIGRYEIIKVLGKGGMGEVYLAKDTELERLVALKAPLRRFANHPEVAARFAREARIGATFQHPRFCPVHDLCRIDDRPVLAMGFIEGETLAEKLKRSPDGRMSETAAAEIVREISLALAVAHQRGIIHRDLKPSNIMINADGDPIIMDFGLAKRSDGSDDSLTATGSPIGTPHYMPPEQVRGDKDTMAAASDIYSLGVILYELLTGRRPFDGAMSHVFVQIATTPPEKPSRLRPDLNPALEAACLKAMAKEPKDRYESMAAFAEALKLEPRKRSESEGKSGSRAWMVWTTLIAAAVLLGVWLNQPKRPDAGIAPPAAAGDDSGETKVGGERVAKSEPPIAESVASKSLKVVEPVESKPRPAPEKTEAPKASPKPLDVVENSIGMKLVLIPEGTFEMGSDDSDKDAFAHEKPKHSVRITRPFWLGQTEVTVGQFSRFVRTGYRTEAQQGGKGARGFDPAKGKHLQDPRFNWRNAGYTQSEDHPVVNVSWNDAVAFCNWLGNREGKTYRPPTEAEWEYACRAGTKTRYSNGDDSRRLSLVANIADKDFKTRVPNYPFPTSEHADGFPFAAPVGRFAANDFKLYDMHGNVWELCSDGYDSEYYRKSPVEDPLGSSLSPLRVRRGGSWLAAAEDARSARRTGVSQDARGNEMGFRVAAVQAGP